MSHSSTSNLSEPDPRRWIGLFAALTAPFLGVVDFFVANLALPAIEKDLGATFAQQELVIALYALANAVFVITGGRLGDTHGRRRVYLIGLSGFLVASLGVGVAPSPWFLLGARFVQGLAAAMLFPQVIALVQVSFPEHERPRALAYFGLVVGLASITGQLLGGWLLPLNVFGLGWRVLFLINLPIGGVALWIASRTLREVRGAHPPKLDLSGVFLASAALVALLVPVTEGPEKHWPSWCIALLAASVPFFAAFVWHERRAARAGRDPLVDATLFRLRTFRTGIVVVATYYGGLAAFFLVLSLYFQKGLGRGSMQAAIAFLPYAVTVLVSSLVASRFASQHGRRFMFGGLALVCVGLVLSITGLLGAADGVPGPVLFTGLALFGLGHGSVSPTIYSAVLIGVPHRSAGSAAGLLSTAQQVASAFGVAGIGFVFHALLAGAATAPSYARAAAGALGVNLVGMAIAAVCAARLSRSAHPSAPVAAALEST